MPDDGLVVRRAGVGEEGFVAVLGQLVRLGVISRREKIAWLELHGAVMRATSPPMDDGHGIDEEELETLAGELGASVYPS